MISNRSSISTTQVKIILFFHNTRRLDGHTHTVHRFRSGKRWSALSEFPLPIKGFFRLLRLCASSSVTDSNPDHLTVLGIERRPALIHTNVSAMTHQGFVDGERK
ncbi:hypothetical protein ACOME3_009532 [Neoechinorhynchus agilis]